MEQALRHNQQRLVTNFDLYQVMFHVLFFIPLLACLFYPSRFLNTCVHISTDHAAYASIS